MENFQDAELRKKIGQASQESELSMHNELDICLRLVSRDKEISQKIQAARDGNVKESIISLLESQRVIVQCVMTDYPLSVIMAKKAIKANPTGVDCLSSITSSYEADPTLTQTEALEKALKMILLYKDLQEKEERKLINYEQFMKAIDLFLAKCKTT